LIKNTLNLSTTTKTFSQLLKSHLPSPIRSRDRFTFEEDLGILECIQKNKKFDFKLLSSQLNRSFSTVYLRWQYHLLPWLAQEQGLRLESLQQDEVILQCIDKQLLKMKSKTNNQPLYLDDNKSKKYTKKEDELILKGVAAFGNDWKLIAQDLPGRTPYKIASRYQNVLNPVLKRGKKEAFTSEEDALLLKALATTNTTNTALTHNTQKTIRNLFLTISKNEIPHRSPLQLKQRWQELTCQTRHIQKFSQDELLRFKKAFQTFGVNFSLLQQHSFPQYTPSQLRRFWIKQMSIDPDLYTLSWNSEKDQLLIDAVQKYGFYAWHKIKEVVFQEVIDPGELKGRYYFLLNHLPRPQSLDLLQPRFPFDTLLLLEYEKQEKNITKTIQSIPSLPESIAQKRLERLLSKTCKFNYFATWTPQEDELLTDLVTNKMKSKELLLWGDIALHFPGKSKKECLQRWKTVLEKK
jgi:hypothetical protein